MYVLYIHRYIHTSTSLSLYIYIYIYIHTHHGAAARLPGQSSTSRTAPQRHKRIKIVDFGLSNVGPPRCSPPGLSLSLSICIYIYRMLYIYMYYMYI